MFEHDSRILQIKLPDMLSKDDYPLIHEEVKARLVKDPQSLILFNFEEVKEVSETFLKSLTLLKEIGVVIYIININPDIFSKEVYSKIIHTAIVYRRIKEISLDGAPMIGRGYTSEVYRLDDERVVKIFNNAVTLYEILYENHISRMITMAQIPAAIGLGIVTCNGKYGIEYELMNSGNVAEAISTNPDKFDEYMDKYTELISTFSTTSLANLELDSKKAVYIDHLREVKDEFSDEEYSRLRRLLDTVPNEEYLVHGDIQLKNIMIHDDEMFAIDMQTLGKGNAIFELAPLYSTYYLFSEGFRKSNAPFQGISEEMGHRVYTGLMDCFFEGAAPEVYELNFKKVKMAAYLFMFWWFKHYAPGEEYGVNYFKNHILENMYYVEDLVLEDILTNKK